MYMWLNELEKPPDCYYLSSHGMLSFQLHFCLLHDCVRYELLKQMTTSTCLKLVGAKSP